MKIDSSYFIAIERTFNPESCIQSTVIVQYMRFWQFCINFET